MTTETQTGQASQPPVETQARLIYEQQQRSQRTFAASVVASWVILLALLGLIFSGVNLALGPINFTTIHLDLNFIGYQFVCTRDLIFSFHFKPTLPFLAFEDSAFCISGGVWETIEISFLSIMLATVLALLAALGRLSRIAPVYALSTFYVSLIRGTPLFLQVMFFFLALPQLGVDLPGLWAGMLALGLNYGAYMSEIFRAGILSVGRGQREAAIALGMTYTQMMRRIVLPQALRFAIPPTGNEFIAMLKDSALVSATGFVHEIMWRAQKVGRSNFRNLEALLIAAVFYWIMTMIFSALQSRLEQHMAQGER